MHRAWLMLNVFKPALISHDYGFCGRKAAPRKKNAFNFSNTMLHPLTSYTVDWVLKTNIYASVKSASFETSHNPTVGPAPCI